MLFRSYEVLKDPKKRSQYDQMRAMGANPFAQRPGNTGQSWGPGPGMGGADFGDLGLGDLFEEIFNSGNFGGRASRNRRSWGGGGFAQKGQDREAVLTVSLMEVAQGGEKMLEMTDGKKLSVKIPEGVDSGTKIKLSGQGEKGIGGGPNGDLILTIEVLPHPIFSREKNDIILKLPVTFSEVVLGKEIEVPTLTEIGRAHV